MKKTLLIAALASAALVSCSKDEVVKINQDEIKFSVVADNQTKAAHVYCSNNLMSSFTVSADYGSKVYIAGDQMAVAAGGNVTYTNAESPRYWPNVTSTKMTFYAIADGSMDAGRTGGNAPTVTDFTVNGTVANQTDLLYAVETVTAKPTDGVLALNFRHALSLIEFKAKKTNENLLVTVTGVKVGNVLNKGTFTFPITSTSDKNVEHTDNENVFASTAALASWSHGSTRESYVVDGLTGVELDATAKALTYLSHSGSTSANNSMILMPQTLNTPWSSSLTGTDKAFTTTTKSYLAVECVICNNDANKTQLHSGWAYMPLGDLTTPPTWEPGKKYVYTFVFGNGNAGYDDNGNPVLSPISYTVSVDDFDAFAGGNKDVEME